MSTNVAIRTVRRVVGAAYESERVVVCTQQDSRELFAQPQFVGHIYVLIVPALHDVFHLRECADTASMLPLLWLPRRKIVAHRSVPEGKTPQLPMRRWTPNSGANENTSVPAPRRRCSESYHAPKRRLPICDGKSFLDRQARNNSGPAKMGRISDRPNSARWAVT